MVDPSEVFQPDQLAADNFPAFLISFMLDSGEPLTSTIFLGERSGGMVKVF